MKKYLASFIIVSVLIPTLVFAQAQNNDAQIRELLALISRLQNQLAVLLAGQNSSSVPPTQTGTQSQSLFITNPSEGESWTLGDTQEFTWKATNFAVNEEIKISLIHDKYRTVSKIVTTKNTGSYVWTVKGVEAGSYSVRIEAPNKKVANIVGPFTIKAKESQVISINAGYSIEGFRGEHKRYVLDLSGGTKDNRVHHWILNFTCSSNIDEALAKVAGDVCTGEDYQIGASSRVVDGDIKVPLDVLYNDPPDGTIEVNIKAVGKDGKIMDETDFEFLVVDRG